VAPVDELARRRGAVVTIRRGTRSVGACWPLRGFMFDRVYLGPHVEAEHRRARDVVQAIFERLVAEPERLPPGHGELADRVTDYLAGMTDRFALAYAAEL